MDRCPASVTWRLLLSAALLGGPARSSSPVDVGRRVPGKQVPGGSAPAAEKQPVLLGLRPDSGPADGGTRVSIRAIGLGGSVGPVAVLRGIQPKRRKSVVRAKIECIKGSPDEFFFVTPNLTTLTSPGAGLLVSVEETVVVKGRPRGRHASTSPVLFRVMEPLLKLAPAWISPCCDFKLSGGQGALLSGAVAAVPAVRPLVRVRGIEHQQDVEGQLVLDEWGIAELSADVPAQAWHVYAVMPPWPYAEKAVTVEISWNHQQFAQLPHPVNYVFQKSLFGKAAEEISEKHLTRGKQEPVDAPEGGKVTVVNLHAEEPDVPGNVPDYGEMLLLNSQGDAFILARSKDLSHLSEDLRIIHDLFRLTCTATAMGAAALSARAPGIIGYLVGGVLLGPGCLDMVVELVQVESMSELGVCLLLFCIGLEMTWREIRTNSRASLAGLLAMMLLCSVVVLFAKFCTKTPLHEALCVGLFTSLASTAVSLKAIPTANGESLPAETNGEASALLAILVTQDIVLAGMLAAMPLVFQHDSAKKGDAMPHPTTSQANKALTSMLWLFTGWVLPMLVACIATQVLLCVLVPRFWRWLRDCLARLRSWVQEQLLEMDDEFFTLLVLSYSFAVAAMTDGLGLSVELGAFLAGLSLASFSLEAAKRSHHMVKGLKDIFVAWFFASIGLILNPRFLWDNLRPILTVVALIFLLKLLTGFLPLWMLSTRGSPRPVRRALRTAWILTNVSEFGFVLASKGLGWGVLSRHVYLLLVGANAMSLCFAPWLFLSRNWLLPEESGRPVEWQDTSPVEDRKEETEGPAAASGTMQLTQRRQPKGPPSPVAHAGREMVRFSSPEVPSSQESGGSPTAERFGRPHLDNNIA